MVSELNDLICCPMPNPSNPSSLVLSLCIVYWLLWHGNRLVETLCRSAGTGSICNPILGNSSRDLAAWNDSTFDIRTWFDGQFCNVIGENNWFARFQAQEGVGTNRTINSYLSQAGTWGAWAHHSRH